jgi:hypothetical protein
VSEELGKDTTEAAAQPKRVEIDVTPKPKPARKRNVLAWFIAIFVVSIALNAFFIKDKWFGAGDETQADAGSSVPRPFHKKASTPAPVVDAHAALVEAANGELKSARDLCGEGDFRNARIAAERADQLVAIAAKLQVPAGDAKATAPDAKAILEKLSAHTAEGYTSAESELRTLFPDEAKAVPDEKADEATEPAKGEAKEEPGAGAKDDGAAPKEETSKKQPAEGKEVAKDKTE